MSTKPTFKRVLVFGESAAALSIAALLADTGYVADLLDDDAIGQDRTRHFLARLYKDWTSVNGKPRREPGLVLPDDLSGSYDLMIDAGTEEAQVRAARFSEIRTFLANDGLLVINTSFPDEEPYRALMKEQQRMGSVQFLSPAHHVALMEIVDETAELTERLTHFAASLSKTAIRVRPSPGLIANRLQTCFYEAADTLLMDGALPHEVDEAMVAAGFRLGPYEMQDLSGLDAPYYQRKARHHLRQPEERYITISDRMVEEGRLGKKVGVGWYRYPGGGGAVIDPLLEDLIMEEAHFAGVTRREFSDEEITQALFAVLIAEAHLLLDEGIAHSPDDIDRICRHALGFPAHLVGPCAYARTHPEMRMADK